MRRLACLLFFGSTFSLAQQTGYLDLVTQVIQPRQIEPTTASATAGNVGAGDSAVSTRRKAFKFTLSRVEATESNTGKVIIYEVTLQNTSDQTIVIPWTASPRDIEPAKSRPYEYQIASLAPRLIKGNGEVAGLDDSLIYGSDVRSTTYQIAPGQSVRIRAQTRLTPHTPRDLKGFISADQKSVNFGVAWSVHRVSVTEINGELHETFMQTEPETPSINTVAVRIDLSD